MIKTLEQNFKEVNRTTVCECLNKDHGHEIPCLRTPTVRVEADRTIAIDVFGIPSSKMDEIEFSGFNYVRLRICDVCADKV